MRTQVYVILFIEFSDFNPILHSLRGIVSKDVLRIRFSVLQDVDDFQTNEVLDV